MLDETRHTVPENHPVRSLFRTLTERGMGQTSIRDEASIRYISRLMTDFMRTEDMFRVRDEHGRRVEYVSDLLAMAEELNDPDLRRDHFKYLGDLTLFMLGLYPETFDRPRRAIGPNYYAEHGRRSYQIVAELGWSESDPELFRRLADRFEEYVKGLNWVKLYINDPFFQYMFREFGVS